MRNRLTRRQILSRLLQTGIISQGVARQALSEGGESVPKLKRIVVLGQTHNNSAWHRVPELSNLTYGVGSAKDLNVDLSKGIRSGKLPSQMADLAKGFDVPMLNGAGNKLREQMCIINGMMAPGQSRHGHIELDGYAVTFTGSLYEKPAISFEQILAQDIYQNVPSKRAMYLGRSNSLFFFDKNGNSMQSSSQSNALDAYKEIVFPELQATETVENPNKSQLFLKNKVLINKLDKDRKDLLSGNSLSKQDKEILEIFYDNLSDISASLAADDDPTENNFASQCLPIAE